MKRATKVLLASLMILLLICCCNGAFWLLFPLKYKSEILLASRATSLSPELIAAVINTESHFDTKALSSAGAVGLMQLMPATAREVVASLKLDELEEGELFTPNLNILLGATYLSHLIEEFSDLKTALAAYNAGPNKVRSWLEDFKFSKNGQEIILTPYAETNNYIKKVMRAKKIYTIYF